jgi:hypothetical protein
VEVWAGDSHIGVCGLPSEREEEFDEWIIFPVVLYLVSLLWIRMNGCLLTSKFYAMKLFFLYVFSN